MTEYWYRIDYSISANFDPFSDGDYTGSSLNVTCEKFRVIKITPKGAWLDLGFGDKRFTKRDVRRRFACPTIEEALESFLARKKKHMKILRRKISDIEKAMTMAEWRFGK